MIHYKMRLLLVTFAIVFGLFSAQAQIEDSLSVPFIPDSLRFRCGPPIIPGLIIAEGLIAGLSFYASKPNVYGDKVVGGLFAGSSVTMLIFVPIYWTDKESKNNKDFKKDRIWNSVMMLGMAYGFSRIATYNLFQSRGDSSDKRFIRNLIEINAAYIIPVGLGFITKKILSKRKTNTQTSLMFNGRSIGLSMVF